MHRAHADDLSRGAGNLTTIPRWQNSRSAAQAHRNWPQRLIDSTLFHCSSVMPSLKATAAGGLEVAADEDPGCALSAPR